MKPNTILFLGPCRKIDLKTGLPFAPFAETSRSGRFLRQVIASASIDALAEVQFGNVLPGPVFGDDGRERNPDWRELLLGLHGHAVWRLSDQDVIVALSGPVMRALSLAASRQVTEHGALSPHIVAAAHPSFMMRRPSWERDRYGVLLHDQILEALRR